MEKMKRFSLVLIFTTLALGIASPLLRASDGKAMATPSQQVAAPQNPPTPNPAPPQQTAPPQPSDAEIRAQQLQREREAAEVRRAEAERQKQFQEFLDKNNTAGGVFRGVQSFIAPLMKHDPEFDLSTIPLREWLAGKNTGPILWKVRIEDPALRMDQRQEIAYTARILGKNLNKSGVTHDFFFIAGIRGVDGKPLAETKVVHEVLQERIPGDIELRFSDWVFVKPGDYTLWLVLYDRATQQHNVIQRRVRVSPLSNDPLPEANALQPQAEFPRSSDRERGTLQVLSRGLSLPVGNRVPVAVQLVSILGFPITGRNEPDMSRQHTENMANAIRALSEIRLKDGSIAVSVVDLLRHQVPFAQSALQPVDWVGFTDAFAKRPPARTVSVTALKQPVPTCKKVDGSAFRHTVLNRMNPGDSARVILVVSASMRFSPCGVDMDREVLEKDCRCTVYYVHLRYGRNDLFDDLEKLLRPFDPRTFNINRPEDLRKAIAEIMKDLGRM